MVAPEEYVALLPVLESWTKVSDIPQAAQLGYGDDLIVQRLRDTTELRIRAMYDMGVDVQVLSLGTGGVQTLGPIDTPVVAREANDALAEIVAANAQRFQAFVAIPTPSPSQASSDLKRAVERLGFRRAMLFGRTGNVHADASEFDDLYATAEAIQVLFYLHPQTLQRAIRDTRLERPSVRVLHPQHLGYGKRNPKPPIPPVGQRGGRRGQTALLTDYPCTFATGTPLLDTSAGRARAFLGDAPLQEDEKSAIASLNWERLPGKTIGSRKLRVSLRSKYGGASLEHRPARHRGPCRRSEHAPIRCSPLSRRTSRPTRQPKQKGRDK